MKKAPQSRGAVRYNNVLWRLGNETTTSCLFDDGGHVRSNGSAHHQRALGRIFGRPIGCHYMDYQLQWEVGGALWSERPGSDRNGGVPQPVESESALHGAPRSSGSLEASHNLLLRRGVGRDKEHREPIHDAAERPPLSRDRAGQIEFGWIST